MQLNIVEMSAMDLRPLRFLVLWPHKNNVEECILDIDFLPTTRHFAAIDEHKTVLACCTMVIEQRTIEQQDFPLRLRAMASHPSVRGSGVAKQLLADAIQQCGSRPVWCDAREKAVAFYEKCGWQVKSEPYEIPIIGTHYLMVCLPKS
jgi:predicted GNAT family N-acyltransferase